MDAIIILNWDLNRYLRYSISASVGVIKRPSADTRVRNQLHDRDCLDEELLSVALGLEVEVSALGDVDVDDAAEDGGGEDKDEVEEYGASVVGGGGGG